MDKFLGAILDFFLNLKFMQNLKEKSNSKIINILYDKPFMLHIIKYLIFGVLTTVICIGSLAILKMTPMGDSDVGINVANFLANAIAILSAYVLNRKFVFDSKEENILKEFTKFLGARIVSLIFDMVLFYVLVSIFNLDVMGVKIFISIGVIILNYILSKLFVFKDKKAKEA